MLRQGSTKFWGLDEVNLSRTFFQDFILLRGQLPSQMQDLVNTRGI